jgi:chromosome segregation ATPase
MARCVLFCLIGIGLTVGLNINGPHWKARLSDAKIRSPLMAFINYSSQGNGNNELFTRQEVDKLKRLAGLLEEMKILTNRVTKLEREFKEIKDESRVTIQKSQEDNQETKECLQGTLKDLQNDHQKTKEDLQETKQGLKDLQNDIQETKQCLKDLQNDFQETNERLVIVEKLLEISQRENQPNKFFEGLAIKCAKWAK